MDYSLWYGVNLEENGGGIKQWWNDNFRMPRQTFEGLCEELCPYLTKRGHKFLIGS